VYATDVNGDGTVDILVASRDDDKVRLFLNDGGTSSPIFTEQLITASADGAYSVYATDVNGDGDVDILVASVYDDKVRLFLNNGDTSSPSFTEQLITASANGAVSVYATDVNGDGAVDVLVASVYDDKIRLFLNDGVPSSPSFTVQLITASADYPHSVYATDVNGDGAVDILVASANDDKVRLFLNDPYPSPLPTVYPSSQPNPSPSPLPTSLPSPFPTPQPTFTRSTFLSSSSVESPLVKADVVSANDILLRGVSFDGFSRRLHATENMCCSEISALRESLSAQQDQIAAQEELLSAQQDQISTQRESLSAQQDQIAAQKESLSAQQDQLAAQIKQLEHQQILLTKRLSQFELGGHMGATADG